MSRYSYDRDRRDHRERRRDRSDSRNRRRDRDYPQRRERSSRDRSRERERDRYRERSRDRYRERSRDRFRERDVRRGGGGGGGDRQQERRFEPRNGNGRDQFNSWAGGRAQLEPTRMAPVYADHQVKAAPITLEQERAFSAYRAEHKIQVLTGERNVNLYMDFDGIPFGSDTIRQKIVKSFDRPTAIQSQSWPILLEGKDLIGIAKTGSGKTLGYLLPLIIQIRSNKNPPQYSSAMQAPIGLVLGPTRELVQQIQIESEKYSQGIVKTAAVYGGVNKYQQMMCLQGGGKRTEILIATPGRLIDLLESRKISLEKVTYLVLDEADRMLDMGFEPQIKQILSQVNPGRQLSMFSATWPKEIQRLANSFMRSPVHIQIGDHQQTVNQDIEQHFILSQEHSKDSMCIQLLNSISAKDHKCLIFCQTKRKCNTLSDYLNAQGMRNEAIHGDKPQKDRERILLHFKRRPQGILIASDVAARGLDIKDIQLVVNLDMPTNIDSYVHRIGRTGRAGNKGISVSFITSNDHSILPKVERLLKASQVSLPSSLQLLHSVSHQGHRLHSYISHQSQAPDYNKIIQGLQASAQQNHPASTQVPPAQPQYNNPYKSAYTYPVQPLPYPAPSRYMPNNYPPTLPPSETYGPPKEEQAPVYSKFSQEPPGVEVITVPAIDPHQMLPPLPMMPQPDLFKLQYPQQNSTSNNPTQ